MAVAWSKTKVGSAEATVIVRDPVVVTATLPRFLDLGDRSQMHVDIDNVEGEAGDYRLDLDIHGPLTAEADALSQTVKLAAHQRVSVDMPIAAAGVGTATLDLKISGPGLSATQRLPLGVEAGAPDVYRRVVQPARGGRERDDLGRSDRRIRARHRLGFGRRFAVRRARRAGGAAGARPLSLRLLGADGQPRHAAALRQPARQPRTPRHRPRPRRAHPRGDRQAR